MSNNEKRDRSVVLISNGLSGKQASKLVADIMDIKEKYAPGGRGTVRKERYEAYVGGARHKGIRG